MSTVFENEKTVFFAGDGDGAGSQASGCLKSWWDSECPNGTEVEKGAARDKLMDEDGSPVVDETEIEYGFEEAEFTIPGVQAMGVEVGMCAYIYNPDTGDITPGIYEITHVDTNHIKCENMADGGVDNTCDVIIGGEFLLQDALDETDANEHSVDIYVRDNLTLSSTSIDVSIGGNNTKNTFKRIIGYRTSPGDMSHGGTYYQSPLEILQNGSIDADKTVLLDADDGAFELINIDADNILIENFHFYNTNNENAVLFSNTPKNIVLRNCRFSDVKSAFNAAADFVLIDSCYTHDDLSSHSYVARGLQNIFINSVSNTAAGFGFVNINTVSATVIGCIAIGGQQGVRVNNVGASCIIKGNTFYNMSLYGVEMSNGGSTVIANNIFSLSPGAVGIHVTTSGSCIYNDYNCFIETDGTPLTVGSNGSGYEVPVKGAYSVQVDPDFVDAANGDFRARNPLLLRGGRPGSDGRAAVIGAIDQEYQFAERGRMMNPGRMTIFR